MKKHNILLTTTTILSCAFFAESARAEVSQNEILKSLFGEPNTNYNAIAGTAGAVYLNDDGQESFIRYFMGSESYWGKG